MSSSFVPSVPECEEQLRRILKGWRSRYKFIILLKHSDKRVVQFTTEWSRRPTPHDPLPSLRVSVEFSFLFDTKAWVRGGHSGPTPPVITFRIGHESLVHSLPSPSPSPSAAATAAPTKVPNIDHHILRHLQFAGEFARRNPLPLTVDQREFFASRAAYEPLSKVQDTHLSSFAEFAASSASSSSTDPSSDADGRNVERSLIDMFQRADNDGNGSLDPEEFEQLLLKSKWGFSKEDVAIVMQQHDANDDGTLTYSEFIPIAIDLVQAQRASAYAQVMTTNLTESAYQSALARVQNSKDLHEAMDAGLGALDPRDTGNVTPAQLAQLLANIDMDLTDGEIQNVINKLKQINREAAEAQGEPAAPSRGVAAAQQPIAYKLLQDNYESLLLDCLQSHALDSSASDVEVLLYGLFEAQDPDHEGTLDEVALRKVLEGAPGGLELSSTQIYAMMGDHRPTGESEGIWRTRNFARKAAHMIYQLFDAAAIGERTSMIARASITPVQLLGSQARRKIEFDMKARFVEFDADADGQLSPAEFAACMSDTGLLLSAAEVEVLRLRADKNKDGMVDRQEFLEFTYDTLLHLQRDAALKTQMAKAIKQKEQEKVGKSASTATEE